MKLILTFFLFPFVLYGQTVYKGTILSKRTNQTVPFATVGLIYENIGTNSDENGVFELKSMKSIPNDTIIISCLGYDAMRVNAFDFNNSRKEIYLIEHLINLKEAGISRKKKSGFETLNKFSKSTDAYIGKTGNTVQLAQHFKSKYFYSQLTKIKICLGPIFGLKKARYRIRVYNTDSMTLAPSTDICSQIIEVRTFNTIVSINLEKYKIIIPGKDFFVAIEWLRIPSNGTTEVFKNAITYMPTVGWDHKTDSSLEHWQLEYNGRWTPVIQQRLLLSATIKN